MEHLLQGFNVVVCACRITSLRIAVMICATLVNTQTHTERQFFDQFILPVSQLELKTF